MTTVLVSQRTLGINRVSPENNRKASPHQSFGDFFRRRSREAKGNTAYFTDPSVQAWEEEEDGDGDSALWAAVRKLPDQQRDAVLLVYADGASHREAAQALGCAEATVSYHVHSARKRLKILLTEDVQ